MRIKCSVTVDIDVEAWVLNYGVDKNEVRADVKSYVEEVVKSQLERVGVLCPQS